MALYKSDITEFLSELKQRNPRLEAEQRQGRSLLWDRQLDPDFLRQAREAKVRQKPYVYQTES